GRAAQQLRAGRGRDVGDARRPRLRPLAPARDAFHFRGRAAHPTAQGGVARRARGEPARAERRDPQPHHAGERRVPDRLAPRRVPRLSRGRAARLHHLRVRDAAGRERRARARARARAAPRGGAFEGEPDPVQPVPGLGLRAQHAGARAPLPEDPPGRRLRRHRAQDARGRHRRRLRAARRPGGEPDEAEGRPPPFHFAEVLMGDRSAALAALVLAAALAGCVSNSTVQSRPVTEDSAGSFHTALASEYFARGNLTVALSETQLAIKDDPNYAQAYNMQGLVYMELREDVS